MAPRSELLAVVLLIAGCGHAAEEESTSIGLPDLERGAIHAWLDAGSYASWQSESEVLPGLNGAGRRVFLSDSVEPTLSPIGAAAVRELYDLRGPGEPVQIGWSLLVKTNDEGTDDDWFFYETFDLVDPARAAVAEVAAPGCTSCHASAPDIIQSTLPLP